jgi:tryptophanyl-tRNA synthetase
MDTQRQRIALTGDRPTGKLHLGHYIGSLKQRVDLQTSADVLIMIADGQALTDHADRPETVRAHILEVLLDYLAVGLDPNSTTIFIQSKVSALTELTSYYLNLITWNRLKHNPTVKLEIQQKGFGDEVPAGFMIYPVSQAADITAFDADIVPVGDDQIPMIELTVEIVRKFNRLYKKEVLKEPKALVPSIARLPGIDGKAKMGKSLKNAIYLSDTSSDLEKKIKQMYTDPNHTKIEDPGQVEGNPVFTYLDAFATDHLHVQSMKEHYQRGGLADVKVKQYLFEVLNTFLTPIRERRKALSDDVTYLWGILKQGTLIANQRASQTLNRVRSAIGIDYPI